MEATKTTRSKTGAWPSEKGGAYLYDEAQKGGAYLPCTHLPHSILSSSSYHCGSVAAASSDVLDVPLDVDVCSASLVSESWSEFYPCSDEVWIPEFVKDILFPKYKNHQRKRKERRRLDLLLWVCHLLGTMGAYADEGAPLNMRFAESLFGKRQPVLDELLRLEIVWICKPAVPNVSCARYQFTERDQKPRKVILKDPDIIQWKGSKERYAKARLRASGISTTVFDNLLKFTPSSRFADCMNQVIDAHTGSGSENLTLTKKRILSGYWQFSIKQHRITSHIVCLPKEVRGTFQVGEEPTAERDFPNCHPCFLPTIFAPLPDATQEDINEHRSLIELVSSGKFYEATQDCWEADKQIFKDYIKKRETEEPDEDGILPSERDFLAKDPRKGIKLCWQVIFNGKGDPTRLFCTNTWHKFSELFPITATRLASYKRSNPRALGDELRRREGQMLAEILTTFKDADTGTLHPCVPLYDGLLCPESLVSELIEVCRKVTLKHLEFVHLPV
jgi:hypothetical protein